MSLCDVTPSKKERQRLEKNPSGFFDLEGAAEGSGWGAGEAGGGGGAGVCSWIKRDVYAVLWERNSFN
jgi:hypothetical protein